MTLAELFPESLTDNSCIFIDKDREVSTAIEMCAQYLESTIDSIVVKDNADKAIGIVGGFDLLSHIRKNPSRESQYQTKVEEIMFNDVPEVTGQTLLKDLMELWKTSRRAFAVISNENDYSPVSARKMLEIGKKIRTDLHISSFDKKNIVTFKIDYTLDKILDLMIENNTRKLLLQDTNLFINDRLILSEISRMLKFQQNFEYFLDIPAKDLKLDYVMRAKNDLTINQLCSMMDKMDHPFVMYKDNVFSPWDICLVLTSETIKEPLLNENQKLCPHCWNPIY
jgi:CBS domain-containing protein